MVTFTHVSVIQLIEVFFLTVLGTIFTHKSIRDRLEKATTSMMAYDCRDVDYLGCYLLDDGAFLISTNQESSRTSVSMCM